MNIKDAMSCFTTGVTVVTAHTQGQDWGMTCNSFNTVSLDPAMVLWSVRKTSASHQHSDLTLMGLSNPALANLKVGEEFATPGVSSGGFEEYLPAFTPAQVKYLFENIVDDLRWLNPSQRGYLKMTFTATEAKGEWIFVNQVLSRTYTAEIGHTAPFRAASKAVTPD